MKSYLLPNYKAAEIKSHIDSVVIGQEDAKRLLSLLFSMHLAWGKRSDSEHPSPNALIIGPTGCGKTHSIRAAAKFLGLPFIVIDSTSLVPAGYKGRSLAEILDELISEARRIVEEKNVVQANIESLLTKDHFEETEFIDSNQIEDQSHFLSDEEQAVQLASKGIIFFDEFDKLAAREGEENIVAYRNETQRHLLKMVEGTIMRSAEGITLNTAGILLLAGGAFSGIDDADIRSHRSPELRAELARTGQQDSVVSSDVIQYGFMPELVARIPILIHYSPLTEEALLEILNNPHVSPLRVWQNHFSALGKSLNFDPKFLAAVANKAVCLELGARGLQQVLFPCLTKEAYDFEISENQEITVYEHHLS